MEDAIKNQVEFVPEIKPWQRLAARLHATGTPMFSIAPQVNQPVEAVSAFITSPQGRAIVAECLTENTLRLQEMLRGAGVDSLMTLIRLRDNSQSEVIRVKCAESILNRTLPALKPINDTGNKRSPVASSLGLLSPEDQIERLRKELNQV